MKTFEKPELDYFLELPLVASSFMEIDKEYSCIHDDNDGNIDQCLRITLTKNSLGHEVLHLKTPTSHGLRFRTHRGGGSSLQVYNALGVVIYASLKIEELFLPGFERKNLRKNKLFRMINDILEGIIVLPSEVFRDKRDSPHFFFDITSQLMVAISVDGDMHIITRPNTEIEKQIDGESTLWNPEPMIFDLKTNCSRSLFNALILLAVATKNSAR